MAALSDNEGMHKIIQIAINPIETTSQDTSKVEIAVTTEEGTTPVTTKVTKTRADTTQDMPRAGDTSTNTDTPEVIQKKTLGLNL